VLNGNHYPPKHDSASGWMNSTLELFRSDFTVAKNAGATLIITPEFALTSSTWMKACISPTNAPTPWCPLLPDTVSCSNDVAASHSSHSSHSPTIYERIACMAKEMNVTLAVNLCEGDVNGTNWNTQAIFSTEGTLLTKYRKTHPYKEKCYQTPPTVELVTFNISSLPFEIGIFTCKDILFRTPSNNLYKKGIRHFVYSSAIPLVGKAVKELWTVAHKDSFLMASDASAGEAGVFSNGKKLAVTSLKNGTILLWKMTSTS
jgi:predicted amidohydrolase